MKQLQHSTATELSTRRNRLEVLVYLAQNVCKKGLEALPPASQHKATKYCWLVSSSETTTLRKKMSENQPVDDSGEQWSPNLIGI